jgi:hypothetical protein
MLALSPILWPLPNGTAFVVAIHALGLADEEEELAP